MNDVSHNEVIDKLVSMEKKIGLIFEILDEKLDLAEFEKEIENQKKTAELLKKPIDQFYLSSRTVSYLQRGNIRSIADLVSLEEHEVANLKLIGDKAMHEIKKLVSVYNLEFGMREKVKKILINKKVF